MKYVRPSEEQINGEWLTIEDPLNQISEHVTCGIQLEGDAYHLGWSAKLVSPDPGIILPLPEVERLLVVIARAIDAAFGDFEFDVP